MDPVWAIPIAVLIVSLATFGLVVMNYFRSMRIDRLHLVEERLARVEKKEEDCQEDRIRLLEIVAQGPQRGPTGPMGPQGMTGERGEHG